MRRSKWYPATALAAASTLVLVGCGGSSSKATSSSSPSAAGAAAPSSAAPTGQQTGCASAKGKTVGYSEPIPDPNFKAIEKIISAQLEKVGASLKPVNANLDPGKQVADIQSLIQSKVSVLIANPVDPNSTKPAFARARSAGIPIVAQETTVGGPFLTNVTADVEAAATGGAKDLKAAVGSGQVAAVDGPSFAEVLVRENTAFDKGAKEAGLTVVAKQANQQITPQGAKAIADAYKSRYGKNLKGIWTFNDTSAIGVASSLGGDFNPAIVSIDAQPEAIPLVQSGKILATYDIQQDKLAQALAFSALAGLCKTSVPSEIVVPVKKYDKSNISSYRPLDQRVNDPFNVEFEQKNGRNYLKTSS